jgi:Gas vesicle protein G
MILLDKALWHGLRFVLENIGRAAETEMDDAPRLREQLMEAQLAFEAGELSADELAEIETQILTRLRALDARGDRKPIGRATVEIDTRAVPVPVGGANSNYRNRRRRRSPRGAE